MKQKKHSTRSGSISRRTFLRGAGGVALSLPYLDYFAPRAKAQAVTPLRLVIVHHGQGTILDRWTPSGTGSDFTLSEILEPLADHQDKLLVLSGINNMVRREVLRGNGHNPAGRTLLTCWPFADSVNADGTMKPAAEQVDNGPAFGPSIDHVVATRMNSNTRFPRLDYRTSNSGQGENQVFWADDQVPIESASDPAVAFAALNAEIDPMEMTMPTFADRLRMQRGSVLDAVLDGFDRLIGQVSADDRDRLNAHAALVRDLESRISSPILAGCNVHTQSLPPDYNFRSHDFDYATAPAMIDNVVMALSCDLTRVATLQFSDYHAPTFGWLGANVPGPWENWHDMIHSGQTDDASRATMVQCMRWYTEQFNYLLTRMDSIMEGDGRTLLDNSLVLWISEFGNGGAHDTRQLPVVMAGGLDGRIQTGRHMAMAGRTTGDLFTTILNLFGHDDEVFGLNDSLSGVTLNSGPFEVG